jgi:hypothetical protein
VVTTLSITSSYVAQDTTVSQQVNRYSTTLKAILGGQTVFEQTYAAAFSDPAVQAAVSAADAILTADHATPGAPVQTSSSTVLQNRMVDDWKKILADAKKILGNSAVIPVWKMSVVLKNAADTNNVSDGFGTLRDGLEKSCRMAERAFKDQNFSGPG